MADYDCEWCRQGNECQLSVGDFGVSCEVNECENCDFLDACIYEDPFELKLSPYEMKKLIEIADKMERVNPISPAELRAALKRAEEMKEGNIDDG